MGRASFGGAQDLSQVFAALFSQYENRLQDLALRAEKRAQEASAAADADMLDRWDKHEISDKELVKYLNHRIREERTDPQAQEYLKQQLRSAQEAIKERGYSDTTGRIGYQFQAGRLTGNAAGAQLRSFAQQFKESDPERYWSLLGQALQMEQYGNGTYSPGGRSGGGSSDEKLANRIDMLKGFRSRLRSLADQFYNGNKTGQITTYDRNGNLHTENFLLANPDGSPSRDLKALHEQTLNVYDQLETALLADGKAGEAGSVANERMDFIVQRIQPANTIRPENQYNKLLSGFIGAIAHADDNPDPNAGVRNIRNVANKIQAWYTALNTKKVGTTGPEDLPGYKGMRDTKNDRSVLEGVGVTKQTTGEFTSRVGEQVKAILTAAYSDDPAQIREALGSLDVSDPTVSSDITRLQSAGEALAQIAVVRQGLADGSWQYAMHPQLGVIPVQVERTVTGVGPDGQPMVHVTPIMYDANTHSEIDLKGANITPVIAKVNGTYQPVLGVAQQQTVATGTLQWAGVTYNRGEAIPPSVVKDMQGDPQAASLPVGELQQVNTPDGIWFGISSQGGAVQWYKNSLPQGEERGSALPYIGRPEDVQGVADQFGLDPNHTILTNAYDTGLTATPTTVERNMRRATMASGFLNEPDQQEASDPFARIQQTATALGIRNRANKMGRDIGMPMIPMPDIKAPNISPVNIRRFSLDIPNFKTISPTLNPTLPRDAASQQSFIRRRTGGIYNI